MAKQFFKLRDGKNREYLSRTPGAIGGHKLSKIYGQLDCKSALRHIVNGHYVKNRVFFLNETIAQQAGYRPCAICLPEAYSEWKRT